MAIVRGAMDILLPKLGELLTDEFKLQKGLKEEIASLSRELESMRAALVKISEVPVGQLDGQVKVWAKEVREMSYDIEDSIDAFTVHLGAAQEPTEPLGLIKGFMDRVMSLWTTALTRRQIAAEIQRIKGEVEEVSQRRKRYKLGNDLAKPCAATTIDPRLPALYEDVSRLVGIERPAGDVVKWLNEGDGASKRGRLKVLSVVGVGGLGKTTLANTVYHMLQGQFQCRAFVSVSLTPDMKKIFCSIIRQVSGEDCANGEDWDVKELVDHIRHLLKDKRYFIIIDDIWDQNVWTILKVAFIESNCGSRIITTTRKVDVAESCCYGFNGRVYDLAPLSHEDSKNLFYKRIFRGEDEHPTELEEVSEKILKKCAGLPLAIITIASLLASKPTKTNELWYSVLNSIGSGHENSPSVENMRGILALSYSDLPPHLKTCLLYLSIFPEDHVINRDKLIWRWIAEDFIHEKQRGNLYEQGENYFNELINRNMIQPVDTDTHGSAKTCRVHDMVLDLITSLSAEENFVTILGGQQPLSVGSKIRRLSFQKKGEHTMTEALMDLSHVRLLLVLRSAIDMIPSLLSFQILRVLDLEECQHLDSHHLKDITNLLHLRYLGLGNTYITEIPKEIGNLQCLQTLDLRETKINELPSTIVQLRQLVRLYVSIGTRVPAGIGNMRSLEELSRINISESPNLMKELGTLSELRMLEIWANVWDKSYEEPIVESLSNLHKIQTLSVFASDVSLDFMSEGWVPARLRTFWAWDSPFSVLPSWINDSLQSLSIRVKKIQQEHVQILGGLPALHFLELLVTELPEEKMVIGRENTFRHLTEFAFECRAAGLIIAQGSLQVLQRLRLDFGVRATRDLYGDFDFGLENLSSVRRVRIDIDCDGALLSEVEALEAVIRNTTRLHLPTLDIRRLEEDMLKDGDKQVDDRLANKKEENWPAKVGPWGGNGGRARDIKVAPQRLESVTIRSGSVVDSVAFSYKDGNGQRQTAGPWGSVGGRIHKIQFGPTEFVTQVSGTFGPFGALSNVLTSLTLVTNCGSYGPFGKIQGTPFQTAVQSNGSIVGFFGRAGQYVDALGVYVFPSSI